MPKCVGERGRKHSIPGKRVFLAKHHFNHSILMKHDDFPHKITSKKLEQPDMLMPRIRSKVKIHIGFAPLYLTLIHFCRSYPQALVLHVARSS